MSLNLQAQADGRYVLDCPEQMEGSVRLDLVEQLRVALAGKPIHGLIVDLDSVAYMSSSGIDALFALRKFVTDAGGRMVLARPNATIQRLLQTVSLDRLVPIVASLAEARAALDQPAGHPQA